MTAKLSCGPYLCTVSVSGGDFAVSGDVLGIGTAGSAVRIHYDAPRPTSANRSDKSLFVLQRRFTTIDIFFDEVSATGGPMLVEKSSVKGHVNVVKLTGSVSETCRLDDVLSLLSQDQIASIEAAFDGNDDVKVQINSAATKGTLSIRCNGAATLD